jgi:hypothetical protein
MVLEPEIMSSNLDFHNSPPISVKYSTYCASPIKREFELTREGECESID